MGNQVISWGAEIFVPGGINQINALSLPKYHTPGTQLKEVFIPAPMASFNIGLTETLSLEGITSSSGMPTRSIRWEPTSPRRI
ncbi:DUF1302 family protein [Pseudomonas aeruginosa]|nr:DUF1302 family protein [Pseudomonas aeruginosa]